MRLAVSLAIALTFATALALDQPPEAEAPAAFDDKSNGMVDDATHDADREAFDEVEDIADGLGPIYNAQACRECHQDPVSGGASQVAELRVGHLGPDGKFQNPEIPIARGAEMITGRTLVNDRAICPNGSFPDTEIHERVPDRENIRTFRISISVLGDGFVEAVPDETFHRIRREQCGKGGGKVCGRIQYVPIVEAPGQTGIGRFGWKDQHASLRSFSGDAYLNEMGITSVLFPDEFTKLCNTAPEPNDAPDADGLDDVGRFARFIRATKAPPRDEVLAKTDRALRGSAVFDRIGCAACHVRSMTTAPAGTKILGGTYAIPDALGGRTFHPFGDFLMHDVGTGDGIVVPVPEHYGRAMARAQWMRTSPQNFHDNRNRVRTAALWGLRLRTRLMHDGESVTPSDAIKRHRGEAADSSFRFRLLSPADREALLEFLRSL
ncbi:MAG TPA: di-heme oxidoredictase family protein [Thermoanaerobaculia bacterium]|nr:di-heme oxidoredictase family protein [Thermoanaerobaculia bacterium]